MIELLDTLAGAFISAVASERLSGENIHASRCAFFVVSMGEFDPLTVCETVKSHLESIVILAPVIERGLAGFVKYHGVHGVLVGSVKSNSSCSTGIFLGTAPSVTVIVPS
jgi:hypothetical protein